MNASQLVVTGTTRTVGPDGVAAEYASPRMTLDADGAVVREERLDPSGVVVLRRGYHDGRLSEEEQLRPDGTLDLRTRFRYDADGRLVEEELSFADGTIHGRWRTERDGAGRVARRDYFDRADALTVSEVYAFAPDGRSATATRAGVGQWSYQYDDAGRVIGKRGGPISGDEMDQEAIEYAYDGRGRLVRETARSFTGEIARELQVTYP